MLFWSVYFIDKSLSLRLGRASSLQDFDISFSAKEIFDIWNNKDPLDLKTAKLAEWLSLSLEMAKIQVGRNRSSQTTGYSRLQGAIYDKLYAPGSIKALSERQIQGQEFIIKIHEILSMNQKVDAD